MQGRDSYGIADGWWGTDGAWHQASESARSALREAMGADEHPDGPPDAPPGSPSLWFLRPGEDRSIWSPGVLELEDGTSVPVHDALPADLPIGTHTLRSDGGHLTRVFRLPGPLRRIDRGWGLSVQLPTTRSRASWGHGDLADLATLAGWTARHGASVLAHNPLGSTIPMLPPQRSPYFASSRRALSPLYLRVEDIAGAERLGDRLNRAANAGRALLDRPTIDRDEVWRIKSEVLRELWALVRDDPAGPPEDAGSPRTDTHPFELDHARFAALAERHGGGRSRFPPSARHPRSPALAEALVGLHDDVERWRWIQATCDGQLAAAAEAGARVGVELMADLPVGFDPDGADAWIDQDLLALGCRIGAPPDDLGPLGQDWGLPPYVPWRLRAAGYQPWIDTLRRLLRHSGLLRIDHVMGLFRLYCIPPGHDALDGAYLYSHGAELLDLAVMEAARAGAVLVGEDLGTVEPEVRDAMAERGVYGYAVGWFADEDPTKWPQRTVAMLSTHDLPTAAGLWNGTDAADRRAAGVADSPEEDARLRSRLAHLAALGGRDGGGWDGSEPASTSPTEPDPDGSTVELSALTGAAYRALADAGSDLVVASLEDAVGQTHRPNLPGTVDEHPNWSLALPVLIEDLDSTDPRNWLRPGLPPRPERRPEL